MSYNPYHLERCRNVDDDRARERSLSRSSALTGVLRSLMWLLMIAGTVVALAAGTQPRLLVKVLDLVLLLAAGSMVVCVAGLLLLNLSDRLFARTPSAAQ